MSQITKVCSHCGASVEAGAKFCGECGRAIPAAATCPNCGAVIPDSVRFCGECGQPITGRAPEPISSAPAPAATVTASQQTAGLSQEAIPERKLKDGLTAPPKRPTPVSTPGTTLPAAVYVAPAPASALSAATPAAKGRISPIMLIGGAAVVVLALAVIVFLATGGAGKRNKDTPPVPEQASSTEAGSAPASASGSTATPETQAAANLTRTVVAGASPTTAGQASVSPAAGAGSASGAADEGPREYIVEVNGEDGAVSVAVVSGSVTVADAAGTETAISAGHQAQFPSGEMSNYNLAGDDGGATGGIPLRELLVDNDLPVPYDTYEPNFLDDQVPAGWVLEDPEHDTLIKTPDPFSIVLTVPDGNDLWSDRTGAPRLLHRATGDFDLEGEILLQTKATSWVYVQFALKAPGTMIGALKEQMGGGTGVADYLVLPSSWNVEGGQNRIGCWTWEKRTCPAGPTDFLHVRLTRRGDVFTTYTGFDGQHWSLHSRQTLVLPETLWAGWLAKRGAADGLTEEPAVVTLRNIRLDTGPSGWMPRPEWDFEQMDGRAEAEGNRVTLSLDGTKLSQVDATVGDPITGDFDVIAAFQTNAWKGEAGKKPGLALFAANYDRSEGADTHTAEVYIDAFQVEDGITPPVYATDLKIGSRWQNEYQKSKTAPGSQGKLRIIRQGAAMSTYFLESTKWTRLDTFNGQGFRDPVTIAVQIWNSEVKAAAAFDVTFTLEQLATGDRVTETVKSLTGVVAAAATAIPPAAAAPTTDARAIDGEKTDLLVHPGYKRFTTTYADISVNIPESWQSLAEEAKGRQLVLGTQGDQTRLEIRISAAGQDLDEVLFNWIQTMKGQVVVPASKTSVGHYEARQMVMDVSDAGERAYVAALSAPSNTFLLSLSGPADDPAVSVYFAAAIASFRTPARCGAAVCPELVQQDAVVGTPVPAPMVAPQATPVGGGVFKAFTFAAGSTKDYEPVDPRTNFPEGATSVFAVYTYEGMKKGTPFVWNWYLNGTEYLKGTPAAWDSDESGSGWRRLYNPEGLPAGNYELRLYVSDELRQQGTFTVEKRPDGAPRFGRILFAENIKDGQPVNPHKPYENFKAGTQRVYAFFDASNMTKGLTYRREWYRDGALMITQSESWDWGTSENNWWAQYYNDKGLASGTYELKLFVDYDMVQLGSFVIE